jgi:hypothetical protein
MKKATCILFILAAACSAAMPAHAQEADSTMTATTSGGSGSLLSGQVSRADSAAAKAADAQKPIRWVSPKWKTEYQANESYYRLGTNMGLVFEPGGAWHGMSSISIAKRDYRDRDMSDINQSFNNTLARIVPARYNVNFGIGQDYLRQKAVGLARSGGDMVIENKFLNTGITWDRPELWARKSSFSALGRVGGGLNDFQYVNNFQASASGHLWYGVGPALNVGGGYGVWRKLEDSDVSGRKFENMKSDMDTISARAGYGTGDAKLLFLDYERTVGVFRKVDPPRGNSLEVIENPDLAAIEQSSRQTEKIIVKSRIQPLYYLSLDFAFLKDYFNQQNLVDVRLSKETELKTLGAKAVYKYAEAGNAILEIERKENDVDYGPTSLSSYLEKESGFKAALTHDISDSLRVTMRGSASLKQRFYKKRDANPRDADYMYYSFFAVLDAGLPLGIRAGVKFTYKQYETINIDRSLSGDNRTDYTYWVVPRFTLLPADWFEIGQDYEIKMEFTDFTYYENENYLNRTTIMFTRAKFRFYRSLLGITHRYQLIDKGSYLLPPDGGERLYGRAEERYEHGLGFRYEFMPLLDFTLYTVSNYKFQETNRLGAVNGGTGVISTSYYDSGEMTLGVRRKTKITDSGKIDLDIGWVRRFGPNLTPDRKEFWQINMNMEINF